MTIIIEDDYKVANIKSSQGLTNRDMQGKTSSAIDEMSRKLYYSNNFKGEEVGLFHPTHSSVVKLTNAGDIEIFTMNNTGLSVDQRLQVISMYANAIKEHLHESHRWLSGNDYEYIKGRKETHVAGLIMIDGDDNLELKIDEHIIASAKNLTLNIAKDINLNVSGNVNAKVKGHAKIEVEKDLTIDGRSNISIEAKKHLRLDGEKVFIGMEEAECKQYV